MNRNVKRGIWVAALLVCLAVVWFSVRGLFAFGEVPISQAPTTAPSPSVTTSASPETSPTTSTSPSGASDPAPSDPAPSESRPAASSASTTAEPGQGAPGDTATGRPEAEDPAPSSSSAPAETGEPAPEPTPTPAVSSSGPPPAPMDEITAAPVHVDVYHDGEQYIGAQVVPEHRDEEGELNPEPQHVGWYAPPQWGTTPGEMSSHPGILTGHVIHSGLKDVFYRLEETRKGDLVVVTYADGTQARFTLDSDPVQMDKQDLIHAPEFDWAWELDEPGRKVTLITCELVPGSGMTGHSVDNWVVQATRVA